MYLSPRIIQPQIHLTVFYISNQEPKKTRARFQGRRLLAIRNFVDSYCQRCSIHGFLYLTQKQLMWLERLLWLSLIVFGFYASCFAGLQSVDRYKTKSTVVGLERDFYFWNTSLPSLTICPMKRLDDELFDEYCRRHNLAGAPKHEFRNFLEHLANATYINFEQIPQSVGIDKTLFSLRIKPEHYMALIYNLTYDATLEPNDKQRIRCIDDRVQIHVRQVLTEYGLCYMANNYLGEEYTSTYMIFGRYPLANKYEQEDTLLQVMQGTYIDTDRGFSFIGFPSEGIDLYIHSPYDVMQVDHNFGFTDEGVEYDPESMEIITENDYEKDATISQRRCRFPHETNLTHFPIYTKSLCMQECRINLIYKTCKCIPHFYPNRISNPKAVCDYKVLRSCFPKHRKYFLKLFEEDTDGHDASRTHECDCLQNCRDSVISLRSSHVMKSAKQLLGSIGGTVSMKNWPHERLRRQIIFSFTDLLVSIGGAAGLFLGFSVLSVVEFVYYFTLRLAWHSRSHQI